MTDFKRCPHCGEVLDPEDDFLAQAPESHRERIRKVLSEALDIPVPSSPFMVDKWDKGLDSIVADCRAVTSKKILDADLASQIVAAIRLGVEGDEWALLKADYPNAAVVGCIPRLLREYRDKSASRSEWAEAVERSQQALTERQAQAKAEKRDPWWEEKLEELHGQMSVLTFNVYLRGTQLLRRDGNAITIGVKNSAAQEWLEAARMRLVVERTVAPDGITKVEFEVVLS